MIHVAHRQESMGPSTVNRAPDWRTPSIPATVLWTVLLIGCRRELPTFPEVYDYDAGPTFLDLGDAVVRPVEHVFSFQNPSATSTAQLALEYRSCGCANCVIRNATVAPGASAEIALAFDLRLQREDRGEHVIIATKLAEFPRFTLRLAAQGYPHIAMQSGRIVDVVVSPGESAVVKASFLAYDADPGDAEPLFVDCEGSGCVLEKADQGPVQVRGNVRRTEVQCVFRVSCPKADDADFGVGEFTGVVHVRHGERRLDQEIHWHATRYVRATPSQLFLQGGHDGTDQAVVHVDADLPFSLKTVKCDDNFVEVDTDLGVTSVRHQLRVRLKPRPANALGDSCALEISIDHPQQPVCKVPVYVVW